MLTCILIFKLSFVFYDKQNTLDIKTNIIINTIIIDLITLYTYTK